jgi:hypothetical protein
MFGGVKMPRRLQKTEEESGLLEAMEAGRGKSILNIMDQSEQITAFVHELQAVVTRFRKEFELPVASAIGCLEMVKLGLFDDEIKNAEPE